MVCELQGRDWFPEDGATDGAMKNGSLLGVLTDLKSLLQEVMHRPLSMVSRKTLRMWTYFGQRYFSQTCEVRYCPMIE